MLQRALALRVITALLPLFCGERFVCMCVCVLTRNGPFDNKGNKEITPGPNKKRC